MSPLKAALVLCLGIFVLAPDRVSTKQPEKVKNARNFLINYGYLKPNADAKTEKDMRPALMDFQGFAKLKKSGKVDDDTVKKMNAPRCGVKDRGDTRTKRYSLSTRKWASTDVTYNITNFTPDFNNDTLVNETLRKAFDEWQRVGNITFRDVTPASANIPILFAEGCHNHSSCFDGPGSVIGHAAHPQAGYVHFDEAENWTFQSDEGFNLLQVACHEIGHAIGISHSEFNDAVMYPYYQGYMANFTLDEDDIAAIEAHYGSVPKETTTTAPTTTTPTTATATTTTPTTTTPTTTPTTPTPTTTTPTTPAVTPPICPDPDINAITQLSDGYTYVFDNTKVYKLQLSSKGVEPGYPKTLTEEFPSAPKYPHAVITDGEVTYFLKGKYVWSFNGHTYIGSKSSIKSTFKDVPNSVNSAFRGSDGKLHFLKGTKHYIHSGGQTTEKSIKDSWTNAPDYIDAAGRHNGALYFFKNYEYYLVDEENNEIATGYPQSTVADWFGCQ